MSLCVQMCVLVCELVCECVCDRLSFCLQGAGLAASLLRVSPPPASSWAGHWLWEGCQAAWPSVALPHPIPVAVYPDLLAPTAPICQREAAEEEEGALCTDGGHHWRHR